MRFQLRYGTDSTLAIDLAPSAWVGQCEKPAQPLRDVVQAVRAAVLAPLDFPSLKLAVTPGDRVCIALDDGLPQVEALVAGLVPPLLEAGVNAADVTILLGPRSAGKQEAIRLAVGEHADEAAQQLELAVHDPQARPELAYLAATEEGAPIYLNHRLVEADVVLPVSAVRLSGSLGYLGVYGGLFPVFSDHESIARFHKPFGARRADEAAQRRAECDEAAWLLGVLFAIQVVPGPGDSLLSIVAGATKEVEREGQRRAAEAWVFELPRRASLVLATVAGGPEQQEWSEIARALHTAGEAASDNAAIVLCTELSEAPGPIMRCLANEAESTEQTRRRILRDRSEYAIAADTIARTRDRARVFLLSRLPADAVEDLGFGYVAEPHEIQRLCDACDSCILVQDAHRAVVRTGGL